MSQLNISFCDSVNLDHIIETAITDSQKRTPELVSRNEAAVTAGLLRYTRAVLKKDADTADDTEVSFIMEKYAGELLDVIFDTSREYIKCGMKAGACLLLELLMKD